MSKKQTGFTLIELVVVVAIIGILAAVAIPAFMKNARKAKTAEATTNVKKIYDGARSYYEEEMVGRGTIVPIAKQFPSVGELAADGYVDEQFAAGTWNGYVFTIEVRDDNGETGTFHLVGEPAYPGITGDANLHVDGDGNVTSEH